MVMMAWAFPGRVGGCYVLRVLRVFLIPLKEENDTSQGILEKATACCLFLFLSPFTVLSFSDVDVWLSKSRKSCRNCIIRGPVMTLITWVSLTSIKETER